MFNMIYAAILAGGKGSRMGYTNKLKQFLNIGDRPIIIHTLEKFLLEPRFDKVIVVCHEQWVVHMNNLINKYIISPFRDKVQVCSGGIDRNESIMQAIHYIEKEYGICDKDIIITHDAVRPFVTSRIIRENIDMTLKYGATDTVIKAIDTIVTSNDGENVDKIPVRNQMYQGQTPQGFNLIKLKELYESIDITEREQLSDAAKIFILNGEKVKLVEGEVFNIKITTSYDLKVANLLMGDESMNTKDENISIKAYRNEGVRINDK